jgi:hypothetical protein
MAPPVKGTQLQGTQMGMAAQGMAMAAVQLRAYQWRKLLPGLKQLYSRLRHHWRVSRHYPVLHPPTHGQVLSARYAAPPSLQPPVLPSWRPMPWD